MNYIIDKPPVCVSIENKAVPINTDFRIILRIIRAFDDDRLTNHEKLTVLVGLMYPEPPDNKAAAIMQGLKFINQGKQLDEKHRSQIQVYNFEKDSQYIYSAFKSSFNIDLSTVEYMHWWVFRSLFSDIGKECFFNTLVGLRSRRNSGKLTKEEKEFVTKNIDIVSLDSCSRKAAEDFIAMIGRGG